MQLPTVPSFVVGDTSLLKLTQLSQCAQLAGVASAVPMWRFYRASTLAISASTWTEVTYSKIAIDTDGVWSSPGLATIVTQGYYTCEACVQPEGAAGSYNPQAQFQWTAGPNNPNYASGTQQYFGGHSPGATSGTAGTDFAMCLSDKCPVVCYPADTIAVWFWANNATTLDFETNANATSGWFVPTFSGRWVRTGSLFRPPATLLTSMI